MRETRPPLSANTIRNVGLLGFFVLALNVLLPTKLPTLLTAEGAAFLPNMGEATPFESVVLVAVCVGGAWLLWKGRRSAIEALLWGGFLVFCWVRPLHQHPPPELAIDLVALASIVVAFACVLVLRLKGAATFRAPRPPPSSWRDLAGGLRLTLAIFIGLEAWANFVVRTEHPSLLAASRAEEPVRVVLDPPNPALPTFVTLASSGGNAEREAREPFSLLLARQFQGRGNFVYTFDGGVNSARLLRMANEWLAKEKPPSAFLFYEGFQDYNYSSGLDLLRVVNQPTGATGAVLREAVRRSRLLTLLLSHFRSNDCMHRGANCNDRVDVIFEGFAKNLDGIVTAAAAKGTHVFVITLAMDESRVLPDGLRYIDLVNDYLRLLARTRPNVSLIDFRARVDADFKGRDVTKCEPYELGLAPGTCGNQYHLSRKGHALLAEVASVAVDAWLKR